MMVENSLKIQQGFRILLPMFSGYVAREYKLTYKDRWWHQILATLGDNASNLPYQGDWGELVGSLDIANCIRLLDWGWNEVFRRKLSIDYRTWAKELMGVRNRFAHIGTEEFSDDDTWRALDTMARLCDAFDDIEAEKIRSILREARYGTAEGSAAAQNNAPVRDSAKNADNITKYSSAGLPSWRDVIEPHPDVAQGRYKNAEFAADLAQVARGEGAYEYRDPVEFFSRTFVTEGMKGLLIQALKRVNGKDGEPVIQLKTAFGGGKTHSMLALYHMLRGKVSVERVPGLASVLEGAGAAALPRANVAVLVGTALEPAKTRKPKNLPGITIYTIWGEMAAQLAESAGDLSLYEYVKESDKKGVAPGSQALKELFDACGPCLVLMDELVAYAKKLYGAEGLPAGTYDNFITFIQEITEAARASRNSLVVASIPESEIEIGGEAGQNALEAIEHTFGRMESIWKPVAANEGFEVVRRRLFLDCKDENKRDEVCEQFSQMYRKNTGDFPIEAREVEYRQRMKSCYPIHPEVFDRLYEDWATLERFQRTRGVLRLMAAVIHELWMGNDASPMIMPGSIALNVPTIRDELTRHLSENWNGIVDREVDGKSSIPYQKDQSVSRYGSKMAARRVARTIMLGSAPTDRAQSVRGIESSRIRLGVVQPGENIADFNDALNTLRGSLAYLYTNPSGDRFWYDTRPTLRKTVEDRATQIPGHEVEYEIERRLKKIKKEPPFAGIHVCPASSLDVTDDQAVRLVILRTTDEHKAGMQDSKAIKAAEDILNNRGTSPRIYRNMLAFVAPDQTMLAALQQEAKRYLAWKSVKNDSVDLNLDAAQNRETDNNLASSDKNVDIKIKETYCWLLSPSIDSVSDLKTVFWNPERLPGSEPIVPKALAKLKQNEQIILKWAPMLLKMELDNLLWRDKDHIQVKELWDYLTRYCYLPRLADFSVLADAIRVGVAGEESFAIASSFSGERYTELRYNTSINDVFPSDILVKTPVALRQIYRENQAKVPKEPVINAQQGGQKPASGGDVPPPPPAKDTSFFMSVKLDNTRVIRDLQKYLDEVIIHLSSVDNCDVELSLEVTAKSADGFPQTTIRTVSENCRTLRVDSFGFDK